jgi:hypothetical protein
LSKADVAVLERNIKTGLEQLRAEAANLQEGKVMEIYFETLEGGPYKVLQLRPAVNGKMMFPLDRTNTELL